MYKNRLSKLDYFMIKNQFCTKKFNQINTMYGVISNKFYVSKDYNKIEGIEKNMLLY